MKSTLKRFLSLVLCMCMVMALLPNVTMTAFAADTTGTLTGLSDENIGLSFSGAEEATWTANGTTITGSAKSTGDCGTTNYETTLSITNNKSVKATLSFDYAIEQNSGTLQVAGAKVSSNGNYSGELNAGDTIKIYLKSGSKDAATTITLTNIKLVSDIVATTTFQPAENGSYTVNGKTITETYSNAQSSMIAYELVATPDSGYLFMGWYNVTDGKYVSTDANTSLNVDSDCTVTARFAAIGTAIFETGGQPFADLGEASEYAQTTGQSMITLTSDGTIRGNYTIPAGITLLIPFDEARTCYTDTPENTSTSWTAPSAYRTLTMEEGSSITVNGAISVSAKHHANGNVGAGGVYGGGTPTGPYGYIKMENTAQITVANGGNLYVWGYIAGDGSVIAESGATVYENMQIRDFRGGSSTLGLLNKAKEKTFFFNQYYIQNVEVPLTLNAGANEYIYSSLYASNMTKSTSVHFIGDGGMFSVVNGGSLTKKYNSRTDRLEITVVGDAAINNLSLSLMGQTMNSKDYVLPITNNMTISVDSGTTKITQDVALLPGVEINIAQNAVLTIENGCSAFVYDADEWIGKNFAFSADIQPATYSPTRTYTRTASDIVDCMIDVNGTMQVNGYLYTTTGGANICSSAGTGSIVLAAGAGTKTMTYQVVNAATDITAVPITPAKLHNADRTYVETKNAKAGDVINYVNGVWGGTPCAHENTELRNAKEATCTEDGYTGDTYCKDCGETIGTGTPIPAKGHSWNEGKITTAPTCENAGVKTYTCTVCNATKTEAIDATGHAPVAVAEQPATCTEAGHTAGVKCSVCGATISGIEVIPATGHNAEIRNAVEATLTTPGYTGDTYCSVCNELLKQGTEIPKTGAHIIWVIDGNVVAEEDYLKGTMPSFKGSTDKAPDENYRYTFTGWSPEVVVAEEDATYTAQYSETARVFYTITFNANGGEGSMEPQRFEVGVDTALNANAFTRENYNFIGWNTAADGSGATYADEGAILELTGDMTLYAQWQIWNGWFTDVNGKQYYKDGELQKTGWTVIDGNTYYLDTETGYAATGITTLVPDGATEEARYVFDAEGVFQRDVTGVYSVGADTYWLNSGIIEEEAGLKRVVKEDGEVNYYYFGEDSKACKATAEKNQYLVEKTNGLELPGGINYTFGEDGVIAHFADTSIRGIYFDESSSNYYYCIDGVIIANGLMLIDGSYYYARTSSGAFVCGRSYWITKTNGLLDAGIYTFDDAGKIIFPEKPKNGIVAENGSLYYYVDGVLTGAGLIQIGNDYYYVRTSTGEVVHGRSYWGTDTNDLLPAGPYTFDTDGKMINPPVVDPTPDPDPTPDVKNGIVAENGSLYYYVDGVLTGAGLIQLDGDYYYVKTSNCEVVHGRSYWITVTNGLPVEAGQYQFADNGKMIR